MNAYQSTARHTAKPAPSIAEGKVPATTLSQEENRIILLLMSDLDLLLQNGITSLTIQKEGSFLESLSSAARTTLESIT